MVVDEAMSNQEIWKEGKGEWELRNGEDGKGGKWKKGKGAWELREGEEGKEGDGRRVKRSGN